MYFTGLIQNSNFAKLHMKVTICGFEVTSGPCGLSKASVKPNQIRKKDRDLMKTYKMIGK